MALQYGAWVTGGDVGSTEDIVTGTGAVVRKGLSKIAAYRDELGQLHECSAICPHLGCVVEWNHNESTWTVHATVPDLTSRDTLCVDRPTSDLIPIHQACETT